MSVNFPKQIQNDEIIEQKKIQNNNSKAANTTDESIFEIYQDKPFFEDRAGNFQDNSFSFVEEYDIPYGYSHYEYNGASFDIYRTDDDYQSQFVHPDDVSREDFDKQFPYLEPINPRGEDSTDSAKTVAGVNGKIDEEALQGATGDCWLISALYSMSNSEEGQKLIQDAIKVNDDNTVTVSFKGIGVSYTLTADEISQFDTDGNTSDEYSNGDNDVLAMELATQKLWKDIKDGRVTLDTQNKDLLFAGNGEGISSGGLPSQLLYYLTGVEPTQLYNSDLSDLSQNQIYGELQKAYQSGNYSLTFGLYGNGHKAKLTNGETFELDFNNGGHALAITDVQKDTVTFVNPWDTSKKYTMSWEEFSKLGVGYMSSADLSKTNQKSEIKDMTSESNYISKNEYPSRNSRGSRGSVAPNYDYEGKDSGGFFDGLFDLFDELIKEMIYSNDKNAKKRLKKA